MKATDNVPVPARLPIPLALGSGLLMGGADAVPGVSGGTIALIIGIYERFIASLSTLIRTPSLARSYAGRRDIVNALRLLLPMGIGVLISYYLTTKWLVGPQETPGILRRMDTAPMCYAFFFGLVLASVREPWRRIRDRAGRHSLGAAIGVCIAAPFAFLPHATGGDIATWLVVLGGAAAISIMLLPGVSGSLFLVIVGLYNIVSQAVHDRELGILLPFLGGILLGVVTFVPMLRSLLSRFHDGTMAVLTGLMAGSLFVLWPWKNNYESKLGPMTNIGIDTATLPSVMVAATCGATVVLGLAALESRITAAPK